MGTPSPVRRSDGVEFSSIQAAAAEVGLTPSAIARAVRLGGTAAGYCWQRIGPPPPPRVRPEPLTRPVRNLDTGEIFPSPEAAARSVGRTRNAVYVHLAGRTHRCGGCRFRYADWEIGDHRVRPVIVDDRWVFPSLDAAARWICGRANNGALTRAIRRGGPFRGRRVRYATPSEVLHPPALVPMREGAR